MNHGSKHWPSEFIKWVLLTCLGSQSDCWCCRIDRWDFLCRSVRNIWPQKLSFSLQQSPECSLTLVNPTVFTENPSHCCSRQPQLLTLLTVQDSIPRLVLPLLLETWELSQKTEGSLWGGKSKHMWPMVGFYQSAFQQIPTTIFIMSLQFSCDAQGRGLHSRRVENNIAF